MPHIGSSILQIDQKCSGFYTPLVYISSMSHVWLRQTSRECDDLEVIQNGFGRWLWEVGKVRNELVRGESGWSSFAEREVKCIVDWMLRIVYEESLVSDIGRACLMEVGYKYRWWAIYNHVCEKFGLWELVNLLWLRNINKEEWLCLE